MAKAKKVKDLDPKGRAKKVKGGGAEQDRKNIAKIQTDVRDTLQGVGPTTQRLVKGDRA